MGRLNFLVKPENMNTVQKIILLAAIIGVLTPFLLLMQKDGSVLETSYHKWPIKEVRHPGPDPLGLYKDYIRKQWSELSEKEKSEIQRLTKKEQDLLATGYEIPYTSGLSDEAEKNVVLDFAILFVCGIAFFLFRTKRA